MKQRGTAMNDFQQQMLFQIFKAGPLKDWTYEEIVGDKLMRFAQAYLMMARALSIGQLRQAMVAAISS